MQQSETEKVFLQDDSVYVSQARFVLGGKTYAMRNISSVSNHKIEKNRTLPFLLNIVGIIMIFTYSPRVLGVFLIVLDGVWLYLLKDGYSVRIQSNSG